MKMNSGVTVVALLVLGLVVIINIMMLVYKWDHGLKSQATNVLFYFFVVNVIMTLFIILF